jgi:hypothetical protein
MRILIFYANSEHFRIRKTGYFNDAIITDVRHPKLNELKCPQSMIFNVNYTITERLGDASTC